MRRTLRLACGLAAALAWSASPTAVAVADPRVDYMLNCRGCHGPDGAGAPGAAPSFRGQLAKFLWVPGGREYLVRVPGTAQSELDDARTAALLNWLLHEFSAAVRASSNSDCAVPGTRPRYSRPPGTHRNFASWPRNDGAAPGAPAPSGP